MRNDHSVINMRRSLGRKIFRTIFQKLLKKDKALKIGFYGHPNSGKTTLANRITTDWLGKSLGLVSEIPHETRKVFLQEHVTLIQDGMELEFDIIDTPGIATKIKYKNFLEYGLSESEARKRAEEATKGKNEAIIWLGDVSGVLLVIDATKKPLTPANNTLISNLEALKIPFIIVANKIDLLQASASRVESAFPQHPVVAISALNGENIKQLYQTMVHRFR